MEDTKQTGPKDVFLQLLGMIFLYASVITFGTLLFQYIEMALPDQLTPETARFAQAALRFPISILVIVFPLYVWFNAYLQKELVRFPEKRELRTRKWLLYFTLFVATLVIIGDLAATIFTFLNGELTLRFILKATTILGIAGSVFLYYGWNVRKDVPASTHKGMQIFVRAVTALGGIAILAGFLFAGSPQQERLRRFDDRRASDLGRIQYELIDYWQAKRDLPETLEALQNDISGFIPPKDPVTDASYEYKKTSKTIFELCATFQASNRATVAEETAPVGGYYGTDTRFVHDTGRTCFTRTIDPDRYPPRQKTAQ